MSNPLAHVGQTTRPEGSEQVQQQVPPTQPQAAPEPVEHPATDLPQHPHVQRDESDDEDAELRHESAV